jgi:hypothetical protein
MRSTNLVTKGLMLFLMMSNLGCISLANSSLPLEQKTLDICQSLDGFCWQYEVCTKKFLGFCTKKEIQIEKIQVEFKDKVKAKELFDKNFVLKVRQDPIK